MGLFSNKPAPAPVVQEPVREKRGLFGKRDSVQTHNNNNTTNTHTTTATTNGHTNTNHGLLHRNHEDPSISAARERVMQAEATEKEADRALIAARASVKQAREHVRRLELEAEAEAKAAKIKQKEAQKIGQRSSMLGRHGR